MKISKNSVMIDAQSGAESKIAVHKFQTFEGHKTISFVFHAIIYPATVTAAQKENPEVVAQITQAQNSGAKLVDIDGDTFEMIGSQMDVTVPVLEFNERTKDSPCPNGAVCLLDMEAEKLFFEKLDADELKCFRLKSIDFE